MKFKHGFTLLEVLVSLFILAITLLSLDSIQFVSLRQAKANLYFFVASQQINVMIERLKISSQQNLTNTIAQWNKQNAEILPQGNGIVKHLDSGYQINLAWGTYLADKCVKNKIGESGCLLATVKEEQ